ncbi:MAG: fibronectin type III domain-containing protein, partial [Bacteroidales bacterium]|nr:fibronectin type III domain-containing protein [Candidatus Colimorpha merdihippi]
MHLYPSGKIVVVYGTAPSVNPNVTRQVGICSVSSNVWTVDASHVATHFTNGATGSILSGTWPEEGRYYIFGMPNYACPKPTSLEVSNLTPTSFDISWSDTSDATSWIVVLSNADTTIEDVVFDTTYSFMDLNPNSSFFLGVAGLCANGDTSSMRSMSVMTPCVGLPVPFVEHFDAFSTTAADPLPNCWNKNTNYTTNYPNASTSYNHSGSVSKAMYMYSTSSSWSYMVLPFMQPSIDSLQLSFWLYKTNTSYAHRLFVGVITNPTDVTTFVPIDTVACAALSTWEEKVVTFGAYHGEGYICIMSPDGEYSYPYLDDLTITYAPACPRVENLVAHNVAGTTADLTWTEVGNATGWSVEYGPAGFAPGSTAGNVVAANDTTITLTGLTPNTAYDAYVTVDCGDEQGGVRMISFRTACDLLSTFPFFEDFENQPTGTSTTGSPFIPCWSRLNNGTSYGSYPYLSSTTTYNHTVGGTKGLYWYGSTTATTYGDYYCIILPAVDTDEVAMNQLMLRLWAKTSSTSYHPTFYTGVISDPTDHTTFVPVDTITINGNTSWTEYSSDFSQYAGFGQNVAIMAYRPTSTWYIHMDDITLDIIPACPRVEDMAASNVSTTSADISWRETGTGTSWTVEYGPAGFTRGSDDATVDYASDTTITLVGLMPNTPYDVYVTVDCGADVGGTNMLAFRTGCVAIDSLPYHYGFEDCATSSSTTGSAFAPCWNHLNNGTTYGGYPYINSSTYNHDAGGSRGLYWYNSTTLTTYGDYQCVVLPAIDTDIYPINTLQLRFWAKATSSSYSPLFQIGVMTDPYDINTFTQVGTANVGNNTNWEEFTTYFSTYTGYGQYLAVRAVRPASNWYAAVDDFTIDVMPACVPVSEIALAGLDSNMLSITWQENGEATSWTIEYGPHGFTLGNGISTNTTDTVYDIMGLTPNTLYDVYITPDCSEGIAESAMATFRTANVYVSLPLSAEFEDSAANSIWILENGTNVNAWAIGSATSNGGSHALYISNDGGTSNSYTISSATMSFAYVDIMVPDPGRYSYSYDWKCFGESTLDYMRAALAPASQNLTAGTTVLSGMSTTALPAGWISLDGSNKLNLQTNWQNVTDDVYITSAGVYHLVFSFRCDGSMGTMPAPAIDNVMFARVACSKPVNVTCSAIGQTSASFSWDGNSGNVEYEYQMGADGAILSLTDTFVTVYGLMPNTEYFFRVRTICDDGDTSFWSSLSVRTACDLISLPYTMDFEGQPTGSSSTSSPFIPCWTRLNNGTSSGGYPYVSNSSSYNHTSGGTYGMYWYNTTTTGTYGDYQFVVLPPFDSTVATNNVQLRFWAKASSTSYAPVFKVGMMTNPNDITSFVAVDTINMVGGNTDWHEFEVPFVNYSGTGRYVAIRADRPSSTWAAYVDDITLEIIGACIRPDSLYAANATASSVDLGWHERGEATEWIVEYGPRGFVLGTGTQVYTSTNPVSLIGMPSSYDGEFYVKALCNAGDTGEYTNQACPFSTSQIPATIPYACNFEDSTVWAEWQVNSNSNINWAWGTAAGAAGNHAMYISPDGGSTYGNNGFTSLVNASAYRDIDFGTIDSSFTITFQAKVGGSTDATYDALMVFLVDPAVAVEAPTGNITSPWGNVNDLYRIATARLDTTWHTYSASLDTIHGVHRVAFFWFNQNTAASHPFIGGPAAVDNITIDYSACPRPLNLDTTMVTSTAVGLTWDGPAYANYRVAYRVAGSSASTNQYVNTVTNHVNITGLQPMTSYYFFVRKECGTENSLYSDGISVTTLMCENPVVSYSYDSTMTATTSNYGPMGYSFYNYGFIQTLIDSAQLANLGGDITAMAFSSVNGNQGNYYQHMDIYLANVSETSLSTWITPDATHQFVQVTNDADLTYTDGGWHVFGLDSTFTWDGHSNLLVTVNRRNGSYSSGASFNVHNTSTTHTLYAYQDGSAYSFSNLSSYSPNSGSFMGDFMFIACGEASCAAPVITSVTNDYESATISWAGASNDYEVNIKETVAADWPATDIAVTGTTYTFTGLNPATHYTMRVRQNCAADSMGYSEWEYVSVLTDSLPCFAPENLTASDMTNAEATFAWTARGTETQWDLHVWFAGGLDSIYRVSTNP